MFRILAEHFDQCSSESDKGYVGYSSGYQLRHVMDDKSSDDNIVVLQRDDDSKICGVSSGELR